MLEGARAAWRPKADGPALVSCCSRPYRCWSLSRAAGRRGLLRASRLPFTYSISLAGKDQSEGEIEG